MHTYRDFWHWYSHLGFAKMLLTSNWVVALIKCAILRVPVPFLFLLTVQIMFASMTLKGVLKSQVAFAVSSLQKSVQKVRSYLCFDFLDMIYHFPERFQGLLLVYWFCGWRFIFCLWHLTRWMKTLALPHFIILFSACSFLPKQTR